MTQTDIYQNTWSAGERMCSYPNCNLWAAVHRKTPQSRCWRGFEQRPAPPGEMSGLLKMYHYVYNCAVFPFAVFMHAEFPVCSISSVQYFHLQYFHLQYFHLQYFQLQYFRCNPYCHHHTTSAPRLPPVASPPHQPVCHSSCREGTPPHWQPRPGPPPWRRRAWGRGGAGHRRSSAALHLWDKTGGDMW